MITINPEHLTEALTILIAYSKAPTGPQYEEAITLTSHLEVPAEWIRALLLGWVEHYERTKKPMFKELVRPGPIRFFSIKILPKTLRFTKAKLCCRLCGQEVKPPKQCWDGACWAAFEKKSSQGWNKICKAAIKRANNCCELCEIDVSKKVWGRKVFEADHLTPIALGGQNTLDNVQILCITCHKEKTREDMILIRAHRRLLIET